MKKIFIWRYSQKSLQISPKSDTLIFFSKTALTIFLVFGLKLVLNMTFNLNKTYFSEKSAIWRYLTSKSLKLVVFRQFAGPVSVLFNIKFFHFSLWRQYLQFTCTKQLFSEAVPHSFSSKMCPANMQQIYRRRPIR